MIPLIVYWSRRDFRLHDNPALFNALSRSTKTGKAFIPLFILEDFMTEGDPKFQFGYSQRYALSKMLPAFASQFADFGILRGKGAETFIQLSKQYQLEIHVGEDVHPDFYKQIKKLREAEITVIVHADQMTISRDLRSGSGRWYSVFTPLKKAAIQSFLDTPETPTAQPSKHINTDLSITVASVAHSAKLTLITNEESAILSQFATTRLLSTAGYSVDLNELTTPPDLTQWYWTEADATKRFDHYLKSGDLSAYKENRDSLELDTKGDGKTSKMSFALAWGLISARTLKNKILHHFEGQDFSNVYSTSCDQGALIYLSELMWREFYKYVLFHQPSMLNEEFQEKFRTIKWVQGEQAKKRFEAWIKGETGYPAVDAAMHQIASIGWMHNRARMMVASILTKNLGIDWRWGQEYFRAVLIDLDEASNNGGWQWGASTGTDPKPIRIFNPYLQADHHDKSGAYQAKWLPTDYNKLTPPLVEHVDARTSALKRYGLHDRSAARDF